MGRFEGDWWNAPEDHVYGRWMGEPYNNVFIGCDPTDGMTPKTVENFDVFLNVADSECETLKPYPNKHQHYYWFPINEVGYWGLAPFYYVNKVLDHHLPLGHKIYHHCHAGAHRSPMTFMLYLVYKGLSLTEAASYLMRRAPDLEISMFFMDIKGGHISPYIFDFLEAMRRHPTYSLMGLLQYMRREVWDEHDARTIDPEIISTRCKPQYDREVDSDHKGVNMKEAYKVMERWLSDDEKGYIRDYNEKGDFVATDWIGLNHISKKENANDEPFPAPLFTEDKKDEE